MPLPKPPEVQSAAGEPAGTEPVGLHRQGSALAHDLKNEDGSGHSGIERFAVTGHGYVKG